jgi:hypothetical protein
MRRWLNWWFKKRKHYLILTLIITILFGIILDLVVGLKIPNSTFIFPYTLILLQLWLLIWVGFGLVMLVKEKFFKRYSILLIGFSVAGILVLFGLMGLYFLRGPIRMGEGFDPDMLTRFLLILSIVIFLPPIILGVLIFTFVTYLKQRGQNRGNLIRQGEGRRNE